MHNPARAAARPACPARPARIVAVNRRSNPQLLGEVRRIFEEYAASLDIDLCFQGFAEELERLPGEYSPPEGRLYLALAGAPAAGARVVGCIALRPLEEGVGELKRMYVRPECRGQGLARRLCARLLAEARRIGYRRIRLDTLSTMEAAIALYRSLGFREIPAYRYNPIPGALYLELELRADAPAD